MCCAAGASSPDKPARHDVQVRDVRVRNVPTNIRNWFDGGTERHGNSIFIFEMAQLCIGHLGHLHHTLNQQQLDEIGRLDVVFVPVDGSMTLDSDGMMEVLQSLKAPLMIPMHFFSRYTLHRFLDRARELKWEVEMAPVPVDRHLQDDAAGDAEGAGAAGALTADRVSDVAEESEIDQRVEDQDQRQLTTSTTSTGRSRNPCRASTGDSTVLSLFFVHRPAPCCHAPMTTRAPRQGSGAVEPARRRSYNGRNPNSDGAAC